MLMYGAPTEDIQFVLNEVLEIGQLGSLRKFQDVDDDFISSMVEAFGKFAETTIAPLNAVGDLEGATLGPEGVRTPSGFPEAFRKFISGGWPSLTGEAEYGGSNLPWSLFAVTAEILGGANAAFSMCMLVNPGTCKVIGAHGSDELKVLYLPKLTSGEWTSAMSLTEAQAGSALGLITTRAMPAADGTFRIKGTKIFNSWGDHDLTENIVHLVLARLPNASPGLKGISLFLVPKFLVNADGTLGARNNFAVDALEKKLGIHASPTCVSNFDNATGYLVGEQHRGLQNMFIVMNAMRLVTGAGAVGLSDRAYQNALEYARQRLAGRSPSGAKRPDLDGDPIIVQPDVRRMLMTMRALVEGSRMLTFWVALNLDLAEVHADPAVRDECNALASMLTPVVKAFLTDRAFECTDIALQCFGGHGFIQGNEAEQYLRDVRFMRLAEGANGIQAYDLINRKVLADDGKAFRQYLGQIGKCLGRQELAGITAELRSALHAIEILLEEQIPRWKSDAEAAAAASYDFLELTGYLSLGFMWVMMAGKATELTEHRADRTIFYARKIHTARFYMSYLLPVVSTLLPRLRSGVAELLPIDDNYF
jgi:alkylation response protein AidB-like acyl-CoA dehydrogenase